MMKTILEDDKEFICDISAPCFRNLNREEAEFVASAKTQVLYRKGENLTKQGAFSSYILFLTEGLVKQTIEGDFTHSMNLRVIQPGEFIGLSTVFYGNVFEYSSVALTDCRAFLVEKEALLKIIRKNGNFALGIIKRYSEQNSQLYTKLGNLICKQMNGRLAETLLYLDSLKGINPEIFVLLSRKDIAGFAAISTESTVKLLKSFEKAGYLGLNDKDIVVLQPDSLREISLRG